MDQIAPKDALSHADGLLIGLRWAFKFKYLSYKSTQAKAIIDQKKKNPEIILSKVHEVLSRASVRVRVLNLFYVLDVRVYV